MNEIIKPVRYGILIGLAGLVFGIAWVFYLVVGHESIHESLRNRAVKRQVDSSSLIQLLEPSDVQAHSNEEKQHNEMDMEHSEEIPPSKTEHDNPLMHEAHERLTKGHIHAMGLGLVTIAVSLILAFTSAPNMIKTAASVLAGIGGLIYPFAWIVMGYRTPSLGEAGAEASVMILAGPGVALVLLGIFTAMLSLLKDVLFTQKI